MLSAHSLLRRADSHATAPGAGASSGQWGGAETPAADWAQRFRSLVEAPDALQRKDEIFALIKGVEATLPVLPEGPIEEPLVHPPNCCCGSCRPSMQPAAVTALTAEETEQILSTCRRMSSDVEAQWRGFMSQMRRPPRGLLGPRGQGVASASSPAVAALNVDGAAAAGADGRSDADSDAR